METRYKGQEICSPSLNVYYEAYENTIVGLFQEKKIFQLSICCKYANKYIYTSKQYVA